MDESQYKFAQKYINPALDTQVIYVGAEWCGPCKMIKPKFLELQKQGKITFTELDADKIEKGSGIKAIPFGFLVQKGEIVYSGIAHAILNKIH